MTIFLHNWLELPTLSKIEENGCRYYITPQGNKYKSVTSVLNEYYNNINLIEWKKRVGEEHFQKVSRQALTRGSAVHKIAEQYLNNDDEWKKALPIYLELFLQIKPILDKNIGSVYGIESTLYSDKLCIAGTCDLLCGFDGYNSVVDFKTSKRKKTKEEIINYFLQAAAYSYMANELTGLQFPYIVIIMMVDDGFPLIFREKASDYMNFWYQFMRNN
jgi:genome maintenance exonuclease 1